MGSLIEQDEAQGRLLPDEFFAAEERGRNPTFTAARFFSRHPEKYRAAVELLGMGVGMQRIARLLSVSIHTILAVQQREPEKVATERAKYASLTRAAARLALDRLIEQIPKCKDVRTLAISLGILTEKAELLSGNPTGRLEVTGDVRVTHADALAYLDVVGMDLEAERARQKGAGARAIGPGGERALPEVIDVEPIDPGPAGSGRLGDPGAGPAGSERLGDPGAGPGGSAPAAQQRPPAAGAEQGDRESSPPVSGMPVNRAPDEGADAGGLLSTGGKSRNARQQGSE